MSGVLTIRPVRPGRTPQEQAAWQGHCGTGSRPRCANCIGYDLTRGNCDVGQFLTRAGQWCALWLPTPNWTTANPAAAQRMGLSHAPEAA